MPIDQKAVLAQIDFVLNRVKEALPRLRTSSKVDRIELLELITLLKAAIDRLAPKRSPYREKAHAIFNEEKVYEGYTIEGLSGILSALRVDYEAGHLQAIHEIIHADVFSDFLDMALYLLKEGYKDPAAVIAGGVLEEHLRKLCLKNAVDVEVEDGKPKKADRLNADLTKAEVYSKLDQKSVTAWLDLRNNAAHGKYDEYDGKQVSFVIQSLLDFITRNPA